MTDLGLFLVIVGSMITMYGVHTLNQSMDPKKAQRIWAFSNPIFTLYFIGRALSLWDGGLSDGIMAGIYLYMSGSNLLSLYRQWKEEKLRLSYGSKI